MDMDLEKQKIGNKKGFIIIILVLIFLTAFLFALPNIVSYYIQSFLFLLLFYIALAEGYNIIGGFTGYINLGYAGWLGMGSYVTSFCLEHNVHWLLALIFSGIFAAIIALIIGIPMLKLRGVYFAVATITFAEGIRLLVVSQQLSPITHGGEGVSVVSNLTLAEQYYIILIIALLLVFIVYKISVGKFGLRLLAIRENELAANCLGIDTVLNKLIAFTLSSFFAGLLGGIFAIHTNFIIPESVFSIGITLQMVLMVILGGRGTVLGPILGAVCLVTISEFIWAKYTLFHLGITGILLVAVILILPEGVIPFLQKKKVLPHSRKL